METVLIVVHLMVVLALVGVVLLQRSEGGGLGIGGGSGFMTARGAANALTRATAILAAAFFVTSLALSILARYGEKPIDILDRPATSSQGNGVLNQLPGSNGPVGSSQPAAPTGGSAPAAPAGGATSTTPLANGATAPAPATTPAPAPANPSTAPATNGVTLPVTPQVPNQ
ncbi:preprotein translocase subunit SecG [Mesorhizobium sp. CA18]|uniref:preprotein translocase subunit SecG n=1 Tax=unclassified Mesorhizobium TaxID=325217 RepID=UPI001CCAF92E|nr:MULTISPECIES: preprotein translocase subunit SecG [unclassified Mesorhizobium]MBZ9734499.1 preprotein translocase subunit SecG [Mesorhizobium sp. CA9]MBZ9768916.1 preprotein translocase subunit SecG [Mesorhizobium sp. CA6]MBZ9826965.1 preprotein translocase subunit SecG [Mesorhizobium sp. CA18]MBZ9832413.1 preprotein translocase subunit SecG [Mesorhizobium sp. CA2]MBZ9838531.1 preprotein translocase subunit SecG [Mesorhizobium sp. CA3]